MRLEQRRAEGAIQAGRGDIHRRPFEDAPQQRVPVRVWAARRDADEHVARGHVGAGEQGRSLGNTDHRAGDVEGARRIDARHLGRLPAEQGAPTASQASAMPVTTSATTSASNVLAAT